MYSPDVAMGLGSIVYALSKSDGQLQPEEAKAVRQLLAAYPYGSLAIGAVFLRDHVGESVEEACAGWLINETNSARKRKNGSFTSCFG